jgi:hypothetical protein
MPIAWRRCQTCPASSRGGGSRPPCHGHALALLHGGSAHSAVGSAALAARPGRSPPGRAPRASRGGRFADARRARARRELRPHRLVAATAFRNRMFLIALDAKGGQWRKAAEALRHIQRSFRVVEA